MIVTLDQVKAQLNLDGTEDDPLVELKAQAAQDHIERLLGFKIEERYNAVGEGGVVDQRLIPPALIEAVLQLAAHWYENREAAGEASGPILFSVEEIAREYRDWTF